MLAKAAAPILAAVAEAEVAATAGVRASLQRKKHHAVQRQDLGQDLFLPIQGHRRRDALHQGN